MTPTTEAGRRLLTLWPAGDAAAATIIAIEKEAVAAALARLRAEAFGYPRCVTVEAIDMLLREVSER